MDKTMPSDGIVVGSTPAGCTTKETSFVYQAKRGFFLLFGAKHT